MIVPRRCVRPLAQRPLPGHRGLGAHRQPASHDLFKGVLRRGWAPLGGSTWRSSPRSSPSRAPSSGHADQPECTAESQHGLGPGFRSSADDPRPRDAAAHALGDGAGRAQRRAVRAGESKPVEGRDTERSDVARREAIQSTHALWGARSLVLVHVSRPILMTASRHQATARTAVRPPCGAVLAPPRREIPKGIRTPRIVLPTTACVMSGAGGLDQRCAHGATPTRHMHRQQPCPRPLLALALTALAAIVGAAAWVIALMTSVCFAAWLTSISTKAAVAQPAHPASPAAAPEPEGPRRRHEYACP
jgi:hypothetical protein